MTRTRAGRGLVLGACLLGFAASACSPDDPPPPPPPATSATPTETGQEREERLAYEAAEKSYREVRSEFRKVTAAGGAPKATARMTTWAGGPYLADLTKIVSAYKKAGYRTDGTETIGWIRRGGYSSSELVLDVCEDDSKVTGFDNNGRSIGKGDILTLELEVRNVRGTWKVWDGKGKKVGSCD